MKCMKKYFYSKIYSTRKKIRDYSINCTLFRHLSRRTKSFQTIRTDVLFHKICTKQWYCQLQNDRICKDKSLNCVNYCCIVEFSFRGIATVLYYAIQCLQDTENIHSRGVVNSSMAIDEKPIFQVIDTKA